MLLFTDDCLGMLRNCMYIPNVRNGMKHPSLMSYRGVYKPSIRNIAVRKNNICSANGFNRRIRSNKFRHRDSVEYLSQAVNAQKAQFI